MFCSRLSGGRALKAQDLLRLGLELEGRVEPTGLGGSFRVVLKAMCRLGLLEALAQ